MLVRGKISLYYEGNLLHTSMYKHRGRRNEIIRGWERIYGWRFLKCALHIEPEIKEENEEDKQYPPFVRPPAIYDNKKFV